MTFKDAPTGDLSAHAAPTGLRRPIHTGRNRFMRLALFHAAGHLAGVLCITALVATVGLAAPYPNVPSVALGTGQSMVVAYSRDFQPLRKYVGLEKPTDVTVLPDGRVLLADAGARRVMLVDLDGTIQWNEPIGDSPIRARPRPGGGFLITSMTDLIAIRADRSVEWRRPVKGIKVGVPLANGRILLARNEGNGWLVETTPNGAVVWQSKPRGYVDASGRWINEQPEQYFASVWSLDVGPDGTIFTTDFDRHQLRILSADHRSLRTIPGLHHVTDTRIGRNGELVAVSPEDFRVWVEFPDGTTKSFQPELRPSCASMSPDGRLLVGLLWEPERAVLNATAARARRRPHIPWRQRGLPVPVLGVFSALLVGIVLRRPELRAAWNPRAGSPEGKPADGEIALTPIELGPRYRKATHVGRAVVWVGVLSAALLLAWSGISSLVQGHRFSEGAWRFAVGCIAGGIALRVLNAIAGCSRTLSSFVPSGWRSPVRRPGRGRLVVLVVLSLGSLAGCLYVQRHFPAEQATAVALWLMAQIWIVVAAFPPVPRATPARTSRSVWVLLALVLLAAIVTRFWQIGYYPDIVHHDHSIYGEAALHTLRGNWQRFFGSVYSVGRPWIVACAAGLELFGTHYWVLRLLGAISGVVIVWGTYLLGAILFNRRIGLIAALLVTVNHALLLYSRQPYVLDPVAPLVLAVYCAAVGLKRGCRWHWCLSGLLSGWALLAYRSSVTFVPIGVAVLVYLAAVYPRRLWRSRAGLLWFVAGACVVYLPMLGQTVADSALYHRAAATIVLLNPNGSLRWDTALWAHQL
ncbi:MAG: glycosyltransferase family 39 protein, partial [Candidatus Binatia bacterium]